jgi:hypothetical protein
MLCIDPTQSRAGAMDQQVAKIDIPPLTNAKQTRLAARRVFLGDQAQPGAQLAAIRELGDITDGRDEGGGRHRTDPWDGLQLLTCGMGLPNRRQLLIIIRKAFLHGEELVLQVPEDLRAQGGEFRLVSLQLVNDQGTKLGNALWQQDAILVEKPTDLINHSGSSKPF